MSACIHVSDLLKLVLAINNTLSIVFVDSIFGFKTDFMSFESFRYITNKRLSLYFNIAESTWLVHVKKMLTFFDILKTCFLPLAFERKKVTR